MLKLTFKGSILILTFFLIILITNNLAANQNFNVKYLSTENGLSNNYVTCGCQDSKGFIWFGTRDGLNRWDGYQFKVFQNQVNNSNSLPDNFIRSIASTPDNNIWIGTNGAGVVRLNLNTETFYKYPVNYNDTTSFPNAYVISIFKQNDSTFWFGTNSGLALYIPSSDSFKRIYLNPENKISNNKETIISIFKIDNETIGIQSTIGVFSINKMNIEPLKLPNEISNLKSLYETNPLFYAQSGNIWFADPETLFYYNNKSGKTSKFKSSDNSQSGLSSTDISGIYEDSQNNIWIITWDGGANLYHAESNTFTVFKDDDKQHIKLSNNIVTNIFEDSFENIWFTTEEGGISYISMKKNRMQFYEHDPFNTNSLSNNKVGSFLTDKKGNIWIGTGNGGLNKYNELNDNFESIYIDNNSGLASILCIEEGSNNTLFIAGWDLGLYSFNIKTKHFRNILKNVPNVNFNDKSLMNIKGFAIDKQDNIWLATHSENGISVYNPKKNTVYNASNPGSINPRIFSIPYPASILDDSKGRLWINSNGGLYMFDGNYHEFNANQNSLSSNYVYTVYEDHEGFIWVGTSKGLDKISFTESGIRIEQINELDNKLPKNIKNILSDNHNLLWLSSNSGITRFNPKTHETKYFQINRNVPVQEFSERSCTKSQTGQLYFGTTHGFFSFHPDSLEKRTHPPQIYFTDFKVFNQSQKIHDPKSPLTKSILCTDSLVLTYKQSLIGFEFTALNINSHDKTEYAYKMEGIDKQWVLAGTNRYTTYANLQHGEYIFRVRTTNGSKLNEANEKQIHIIITPPYYKTKLAYILYFLLLLSALYLFRRITQNREKLKSDLRLEKIKIQNVQETNLMKLRFFTNISHEFRAPLTLIKIPLEKLLKKGHQLTNEEQKYHYQLMLNSTIKLDKMVTQLMDYRKMEAGSLVLEPSFGDLIEFCKKNFENFSSLAAQKSISYSFSTPFDSKWMVFDADKLEKVLSNLLSNAFKNTPNFGKISISVLSEPESEKTGINPIINIIIEDSGIGISANDLPHIFDRFYMVSSKKETNIQGTGIGLALAKELMEMHQGSIHVDSVENKGSKFKINLPTNIQLKKKANEDHTEVKQELHSLSSITEEKQEVAAKAKQKLLLVDDDEDLLGFLNQELTQKYELITALNGKEAFELAQAQKPDIIVSDVMMPLVSGIELCNKIKSNELTSHIPIVLLTARYSSAKKIEGLKSGANAYLMKPFNLDELLLTITNILNSRTMLMEKFKTDSTFYYENNDLESSDQKLIQKIIDVVLTNIANNKINADFIAKQVFVSRTVLYLKIEAITGQTVNEFINSIRLKKAKQLLLKSESNISEIAFTVGFTSQSYFSRTFAKQFGQSPREYIKQNQNKNTNGV